MRLNTKKLSKSMNIWIKIGFVPIHLLILVNFLSAQTADYSSIKDTVELRRIIEVNLVNLKKTNQVNQEDIYSLLNTALLLKDTASFFRISNDSEKNYFRKNTLNQEAIYFLNECQKLLGVEDTHFGNFNNQLGNYYKRLDFRIEALECYFKAFEWNKKYNEEDLSVACGNVAAIYIDNENYEKALYYNQLAHSYTLKMKSGTRKLYNMIFDYFTFGEIYSSLKNNKKAEENYEKSIVTARELKDDEMMLRVITEACKFYTKIGSNENCEKSFNEGSVLLEKSDLGMTNIVKSFIIEKNQYYVNIGSMDRAIDPKEIQFEDFKSKVLLYSANYYAKKKDIVNTEKFYKQLIEEKDRIEREGQMNALSNIEEKFINNELKERNKALSTKVKGERRISLIILMVLGLISSLLILQLINNRRYKKLNLLLNSKSNELVTTNKSLQNSNEELERFAYIASHDLKTPLRTIISFTNLLEQQIETQENENIHKYISFIKEGGVRLHNLIIDTLEYSRLSYSEKEEQVEEVDLNLLLSNLEQSMLNDLTTRKANILISDNLPSIRAHKHSTFLLFQNLIENGIKYNDSITPIIKIYTKETPSFLSIFIEDNGIGISDEYFKNIFVMFSRLHPHSEYDGSGLGLSICKKIIEQLNGEILVQSNQERGSIFEIRLPNSILL